MDCSKRRAAALGDLPVDPLVEILSRVPAKSVCRFKCVSKVWRDLIADPQHRKKLPQAMEGLFCLTFDCSSKAHGFSFIDLTARSVPLDIDPSFSFLTELPGIQVLVLLGSCNGLILFGHQRDSSFTSPVLGYIVCNPTTKEWEAVPPCTPNWRTNAYLAFDPAVSSHFNLVQFQVSLNEEFLSVHAYSSETGTWSANQIDERGGEGQLNGWCYVRFYPEKSRPHAFFKGFLHLVVRDQDQIKIVVVDVQGKMRKMFPVPHGANNMLWSLSYFGESQGHLHYMSQEVVDTDEGKYKLSIWVLQDYDTEEWVFKHTVDTHEVFGKYNCAGKSCVKFVVVDIHQDRDVVFFTQPLRNKLVAYDMSNKEVTVIINLDDQKVLWCTVRYVPFFRKSPVLTNMH
jgi:F-box interacting protein